MRLFIAITFFNSLVSDLESIEMQRGPNMEVPVESGTRATYLMLANRIIGLVSNYRLGDNNLEELVRQIRVPPMRDFIMDHFADVTSYTTQLQFESLSEGQTLARFNQFMSGRQVQSTPLGELPGQVHHQALNPNQTMTSRAQQNQVIQAAQIEQQQPTEEEKQPNEDRQFSDAIEPIGNFQTQSLNDYFEDMEEENVAQYMDETDVFAKMIMYAHETGVPSRVIATIIRFLGSTRILRNGVLITPVADINRSFNTDFVVNYSGVRVELSMGNNELLMVLARGGQRSRTSIIYDPRQSSGIIVNETELGLFVEDLRRSPYFYFLGNRDADDEASLTSYWNDRSNFRDQQPTQDLVQMFYPQKLAIKQQEKEIDLSLALAIQDDQEYQTGMLGNQGQGAVPPLQTVSMIQGQGDSFGDLQIPGAMPQYVVAVDRDTILRVFGEQNTNTPANHEQVRAVAAYAAAMPSQSNQANPQIMSIANAMQLAARRRLNGLRVGQGERTVALRTGAGGGFGGDDDPRRRPGRPAIQSGDPADIPADRPLAIEGGQPPPLAIAARPGDNIAANLGPAGIQAPIIVPGLAAPAAQANQAPLAIAPGAPQVFAEDPRNFPPIGFPGGGPDRGGGGGGGGPPGGDGFPGFVGGFGAEDRYGVLKVLGYAAGVALAAGGATVAAGKFGKELYETTVKRIQKGTYEVMHDNIRNNEIKIYKDQKHLHQVQQKEEIIQSMSTQYGQGFVNHRGFFSRLNTLFPQIPFTKLQTGEDQVDYYKGMLNEGNEMFKEIFLQLRADFNSIESDKQKRNFFDTVMQATQFFGDQVDFYDAEWAPHKVTSTHFLEKSFVLRHTLFLKQIASELSLKEGNFYPAMQRALVHQMPVEKGQTQLEWVDSVITNLYGSQMEAHSVEKQLRYFEELDSIVVSDRVKELSADFDFSQIQRLDETRNVEDNQILKEKLLQMEFNKVVTGFEAIKIQSNATLEETIMSEIKQMRIDNKAEQDLTKIFKQEAKVRNGRLLYNGEQILNEVLSTKFDFIESIKEQIFETDLFKQYEAFQKGVVVYIDKHRAKDLSTNFNFTMIAKLNGNDDTFVFPGEIPPEIQQVIAKNGTNGTLSEEFLVGNEEIKIVMDEGDLFSNIGPVIPEEGKTPQVEVEIEMVDTEPEDDINAQGQHYIDQNENSMMLHSMFLDDSMRKIEKGGIDINDSNTYMGIRNKLFRQIVGYVANNDQHNLKSFQDHLTSSGAQTIITNVLAHLTDKRITHMNVIENNHNHVKHILKELREEKESRNYYISNNKLKVENRTKLRIFDPEKNYVDAKEIVRTFLKRTDQQQQLEIRFAKKKSLVNRVLQNVIIGAGFHFSVQQSEEFADLVQMQVSRDEMKPDGQIVNSNIRHYEKDTLYSTQKQLEADELVTLLRERFKIIPSSDEVRRFQQDVQEGRELLREIPLLLLDQNLEYKPGSNYQKISDEINTSEFELLAQQQAHIDALLNNETHRAQHTEENTPHFQNTPNFNSTSEPQFNLTIPEAPMFNQTSAASDHPIGNMTSTIVDQSIPENTVPPINSTPDPVNPESNTVRSRTSYLSAQKRVHSLMIQMRKMDENIHIENYDVLVNQVYRFLENKITDEQIKQTMNVMISSVNEQSQQKFEEASEAYVDLVEKLTAQQQKGELSTQGKRFLQTHSETEFDILNKTLFNDKHNDKHQFADAFITSYVRDIGDKQNKLLGSQQGLKFTLETLIETADPGNNSYYIASASQMRLLQNENIATFIGQQERTNPEILQAVKTSQKLQNSLIAEQMERYNTMDNRERSQFMTHFSRELIHKAEPMFKLVKVHEDILAAFQSNRLSTLMSTTTSQIFSLYLRTQVIGGAIANITSLGVDGFVLAASSTILTSILGANSAEALDAAKQLVRNSEKLASLSRTEDVRKQRKVIKDTMNLVDSPINTFNELLLKQENIDSIHELITENEGLRRPLHSAISRTGTAAVKAISYYANLEAVAHPVVGGGFGILDAANVVTTGLTATTGSLAKYLMPSKEEQQMQRDFNQFFFRGGTSNEKFKTFADQIEIYLDNYKSHSFRQQQEIKGLLASEHMINFNANVQKKVSRELESEWVQSNFLFRHPFETQKIFGDFIQNHEQNFLALDGEIVQQRLRDYQELSNKGTTTSFVESLAVLIANASGLDPNDHFVQRQAKMLKDKPKFGTLELNFDYQQNKVFFSKLGQQSRQENTSSSREEERKQSKKDRDALGGFSKTGGSGGGGRGKKRDDKKQSKTAYNDENTFKRNGGRVKFGKDNSLLGQIYNGSQKIFMNKKKRKRNKKKKRQFEREDDEEKFSRHDTLVATNNVMTSQRSINKILNLI